jgi:hypothetical protein
MSRLTRGPVIGHYTKAESPAPAAPADPTAPAPAPAPVDQLVTVDGMRADDDAALLTLGPLDPTNPAPLVAVHVAVSAVALADTLDAAAVLATPGILTAGVSVAGLAPGTQFAVPVAGVPAGSTFWYSILEYAV